MRFKTIDEYDEYIDELNKKLFKFKSYVEDHPEKIGVQGNYKAIKHVRDELIEEREVLRRDYETFLSENGFEEWNLHFSGSAIKNHSMPSTILIPIIQKITDLNYALVRSLKEGPNAEGKFSQEFKDEHCLNIKPFAVGSFNLIFEPKIFSNNQTTFEDTWNKQAFDKLFEILNCGDDQDKLSDIHESIGTYSIVKYRELLNIIYSKELDVVFEEKGRGTSKFTLKKDHAKNIYNSLNGFDDDAIETVLKKGVLVAVDTGRFKFGLELSDSTERIDGKYDESLDDLVSNNFKNLCKVKLHKIKRFNSRSGESKYYWELIDIL